MRKNAARTAPHIVVSYPTRTMIIAYSVPAYHHPYTYAQDVANQRIRLATTTWPGWRATTSRQHSPPLPPYPLLLTMPSSWRDAGVVIFGERRGSLSASVAALSAASRRTRSSATVVVNYDDCDDDCDDSGSSLASRGTSLASGEDAAAAAAAALLGALGDASPSVALGALLARCPPGTEPPSGVLRGLGELASAHPATCVPPLQRELLPRRRPRGQWRSVPKPRRKT